jgi:hypothetical protein
MVGKRPEEIGIPEGCYFSSFINSYEIRKKIMRICRENSCVPERSCFIGMLR